MRKMTEIMRTFLKDEEGATMVEYGLMVALIAVVAMAGAKILGEAVDEKFDDVATAVNTGTVPG